VKEYPQLGNQRICDRELGEGEPGDGELADTEDPQSKLRDGYHPAGERSDGDNSFGWHRPAVRTVLERHVQNGQAEESGLRLVFKTESVPFLLGYGAPQLGQAIACSERFCPHSLQGFISTSGAAGLTGAFRIQVRVVSRLSVTLLLPFTSSSIGSE